MSLRLVFIGGGKMGEALLGGLLERRWCGAEELGVVEPDASRQDVLTTTYPGVTMLAVEEVRDTDVVIAVKPHHVADVTSSLSGQNVGRALSIAAGVTIASLESGLGGAVRVVRAMPNTPALVEMGASAIAPGSHAEADDVAWASGILSSVGTVHVLDESLLDAVTGLSGSGPAYVFLVAEAMTAGAIAAGLSEEVADALTRQTLLGAATLLSTSGEDPAVLRRNVTSPGGTTAEGIAVLEDRDLRGAFAAAIAAATQRSVELGQS